MNGRSRDPDAGPPRLERFFGAYDRHFRDAPSYERHLQRLVAGYSRGDGAEELQSAFTRAVQSLEVADAVNRAETSREDKILSHRGRYVTVYREALVFLSFGLCLRAPGHELVGILDGCDRGDPLIETLARAALPGRETDLGAPAFHATFDGLYDALDAPESQRPRLVKRYLEDWYKLKMEGFPFKDMHLEADPRGYVGYWCFEAAGVVAALGVADDSFAEHPHYPRDLVAMYRAGVR